MVKIYPSCGGGDVHMIGMPGKGVDDIHLRLANLPPNYYSVVVLCIGGNDLCHFHRTPAAVVHDLFVFAEELVSNGTSRVIITPRHKCRACCWLQSSKGQPVLYCLQGSAHESQFQCRRYLEHGQDWNNQCS